MNCLFVLEATGCIKKLYQIIHSLLYYSCVPQKATIQIQIRGLIRTTYCGALKFIIAFELRMRKNTQFYTHGTSREASNQYETASFEIQIE